MLKLVGIRGWRTAHAHDERKRTNFWRVYTKTNEPEFARFCPFFAHFWAKTGQKRAKNGQTKTNPGETGRNRKFRRILVRDRHALVGISIVLQILREQRVVFGKNLDVTSYTDGKRETHNPQVGNGFIFKGHKSSWYMMTYKCPNMT